MTAALRLLPLRAAAARPVMTRSSARAFGTTAVRAQQNGVPQNWNEAIQDVNKSVSVPCLCLRVHPRGVGRAAPLPSAVGMIQPQSPCGLDANAQFNAGVKDAASAMEHSLDDISANAKPYAEDIASRLKAVFGDGAPSAKDVQKELERQAKQARYAVEQAAKEVQGDANTASKIDSRLADDFKKAASQRANDLKKALNSNN